MICAYFYLDIVTENKMAERVFLNSDNIAQFVCPQCKKLWKKDLSALQNPTQNVVFNCKCPCGHAFPVVLERRQYHRRETNLGGAFIHDRKQTRGIIVVKNISLGGLGFELTNDYRIASGDVVLVRFNLDDSLLDHNLFHTLEHSQPCHMPAMLPPPLQNQTTLDTCIQN